MYKLKQGAKVYLCGASNQLGVYMNSIQKLKENSLDDPIKQRVLDVLPDVIKEKTFREGVVNFSLFRSKVTNGKMKLIPYGNLRTPYLINNSMLSEGIAEDISKVTNIPFNDVERVVKSIAIEAKETLKSSTCFIIKGLCRVYLDAGKIRISTTRL